MEESISISDITVEYTNHIWKDSILKYIKTTEDDPKSLNKTFDKEYTVSCDFDNKEFKIDNLSILVNLRRYSSNVCNAIADLGKSIYSDDTIINPKIKLEIYFDDFDEDFKIYIKSVLLHEMLHVYQVYNMRNKKMDSNWNLGNTIISTRDYIYNPYVKEVSEILYYSAEHEIMAQIHQYFMFKTHNNKRYEKIFEIKQKLEEYDPYVMLNNVDDKLIKQLNLFRDIYNKRLILHKPNNKYYKNASLVWKKEITKNNINKFLDNINTFVKKSASFLDKKMKHIDRKTEKEIFEKYDIFGYYRYIEFLVENQNDIS
jgi:hypothetical protein